MTNVITRAGAVHIPSLQDPALIALLAGLMQAVAVTKPEPKTFTLLAVEVLPDGEFSVLRATEGFNGAEELSPDDEEDPYVKAAKKFDLPVKVTEHFNRLANMIDMPISVVTHPYIKATKESLSAAVLEEGIDSLLRMKLVGVRVGDEDECFWITPEALAVIGEKLDLEVGYDFDLCVDKSPVTK